jgi:RIO kinase 1
MRLPAGLQELLDEAIIDDVVRQLKSGKEASVYSVRCGTEIRCAKVYKDMAQRSFKQRAQYQEGRKTRGSRDARAMAKSSRYGKKELENAWKNAEVDALYQLAAAGVRVPRPFGFFNGVLIMEMVTDADGDCAPRLGEVTLSPEVARDYHGFLIRQIALMLTSGLIHGDLSQFNVLIGTQGPVIIDFPQVVNAAGNNNAFAMLERDVRNITEALGKFAPELRQTNFALEMWELFEQGELKPDSVLSGAPRKAEVAVNLEEVVLAIDDARREEMFRREREKASHVPSSNLTV